MQLPLRGRHLCVLSPEKVAEGSERMPTLSVLKDLAASSASFQLTRGCMANQARASSGGPINTTIIRLRRLYFMGRISIDSRCHSPRGYGYSI